MKLFVAIELNTEMCSELLSIQKKFMQHCNKDNVVAKIEPPEDFHITLRYLGDVSDPQMVIEKLSTVTSSPFSLELDKTGVFFDLNKVFYWAGVAGDIDKLRFLKKSIDVALSDVDCFQETHLFCPHITLATINDSSFSLKQIVIPQKKAADISRFGLYCIDTTRNGPRFQRIKTFNLH